MADDLDEVLDVLVEARDGIADDAAQGGRDAVWLAGARAGLYAAEIALRAWSRWRDSGIAAKEDVSGPLRAEQVEDEAPDTSACEPPTGQRTGILRPNSTSTDPVKQPACESGDGWIEWRGGKCPVEPGALVRVRLRDGFMSSPRWACRHGWQHLGGFGDIVAYRVVSSPVPDISPAMIEAGRTQWREWCDAMETVDELIGRILRAGLAAKGN